MTKRNYVLILLLVIGAGTFSCNTTKKTRGALIGATIGGAGGALLTKDNKAVGIILGAAIGGIAGGLIGDYMDRQANDIADELKDKAVVTRVGEGIVVSFDSGLLFDFDSYKLIAETRKNLQSLSKALVDYQETVIKILGHTDNSGSSEYNMTLSKKRSTSVKEYLTQNGVESHRMSAVANGESDPVASNETEQGRKKNRRVEIVIVANENLKSSAAKGKL